MLKITMIHNRYESTPVLEYIQTAFEAKGKIYTLTGSRDSGLDDFKCLTDGTHHKWFREDIKSWVDAGNVVAVDGSERLDWWFGREHEFFIPPAKPDLGESPFGDL